MSGLAIFLLIVIIVIVVNGIRLINQYERGVVFRLGKVRPDIKQPGLRSSTSCVKSACVS
jgi:regulator of protease activity HflC (stomatin/prohibitin superfamily)